MNSKESPPIDLLEIAQKHTPGDAIAIGNLTIERLVAENKRMDDVLVSMEIDANIAK